jgi:ADP-heptose:LPS heptosyltransferase
LNKDLLVEAKIFVRDIIVRTIEKYLSSRTSAIRKNTMLILRTDAIGDYILFRNFIKYVKESEKYRNYSITLCGNELWKDLAETFDNKYIDSFIWIDKTKFFRTSGWTYTIRMLKKIHSSGFEVIVDPNEVKSQLSEHIKKHSGVGKITENDPVFLSNMPEKLKFITSHSNSKPRAPLSDYFQFNANKKFIEELLGSRIELASTSIETEHEKNIKDYIILFPGAGSLVRRWSPDNFSKLSILLRKITSSKILICGDTKDRASASDIMKFSHIENIEDLTGKTTLPQLVNLIAGAKILISNESCAVHIAAAVGTNAVCISNGNHFGKFNPYPKSMAENIATLYPSEVNNQIDKYEDLIKRFAISSDIDINEISVESVFEVARNLME